MDKEQIALKHAEMFDCGEYVSRADMMLGFLAEIDAERGKEAVAWMHPNGGVVQSRQTGLERSTFTIPLFLSPTIPEGMALVPIEPTIAMLDAYCHGLGPTSNWAYMLAAAQGERNA